MKIFKNSLFIFIFIVTTSQAKNDLLLDTKKIQTQQYEATLMYKHITHSKKAILYIHGFNDYFFNQELAETFLKNGYSFFALELHNYGHNIKSNTPLYYFKNIDEFDDEVAKSIEIIKKDFGINDLSLYGYSQGALIGTLYAHKYHTINRLIVDSPFYDFNFNIFVEQIALPLVAFVGQYFPEYKITSNTPNIFGQSLHKDYNGEWDFNLKFKSTITSAPIYLGWIHAIYNAQTIIHKGIDLQLPVLCLYSSASNPETSPMPLHFKSDLVLDVKDMKNNCKKLNQNQNLTQLTEVQDAMHGIFLSRKTIRENGYKHIFNWLNTAH